MPHAAGPASLLKRVMDETDLEPVLVVWADSTLQEGWGWYIENISPECVTIGHLFRENDEVVVVALSRTAGFYGSFITIPRCAVKSITPLVAARHRSMSRDQARRAARAAKVKGT